MTRRRLSVIGEAMDPVPPEDDEGGLVRVADGLFASRAYGFFLKIRDVRAIPAYIPRIARALRADEDRVWDMFVQYVRGVDEPWRA
jgi:hypothetical protein